MVRKAKPIRTRKIRRNPLARALATGVFKPKVVPRIGTYKRRPKHPKTGEDGA